MRRAFESIIFLLAAICAVLITASQASAFEKVVFVPLPECKVYSLNNQNTPKDLSAISQFDGNEPMWGILENAAIKIEFGKHEKLPFLALTRVGWTDWAIPSEISVSVNGGKEKRVSLSSPKLSPGKHGPAVEADIIELGGSPVKTVTIKVTKAETKANKHGSFRLLVPTAPYISQKLDKVPGNCDGAEIILQSRKKIVGAEAKVWSWRFRTRIEWRIPLPVIEAGENKLSMKWKDFISTDRPEVDPAPWTFEELVVLLPEGEMGVSIKDLKLTCSGPENNVPWDALPELSWKADAEGWRDGIPQNGFGRFGYVQNNGLLNLEIKDSEFSFTSVTTPEGGKKTCTYSFSTGGKTKIEARHRKVDWTGVTALRRRRSDKKLEKVISHAYGVYDQSNMEETVIYSSLAPGFLLRSHDKLFSLKAQEDSGDLWVLLPQNGKESWSKFSGEMSLAGLDEGWCVLRWKNNPEHSLLVAFEKKPEKLVGKDGEATFVFKEETGYIGIANAVGYHGWKTDSGINEKSAKQMAKNGKMTAAIMRSYPRSCRMQFRPAEEGVHFRETFSYVCWENEWNEKALKIAPVSPVIAFASAQGYKVLWPKGKPHDTGLDTKYGPYCAWANDNQGEYILPFAPSRTSLYARPAANELARTIASGITSFFQPKKTKEFARIDSLDHWYLIASASLALPLLDEEQKETFIKIWRSKVYGVLQDKRWHIRQEPFSGTPYLISFAWENRSLQILGDANSGIGAGLHGMFTYARSSGDWDVVQNNWDKINKILRYFLVGHDWVYMQTGCREHTASSCIDMDGISYEGASAYYAMARTIGQEDDAAMGAMLLSRLGLSTSMRFTGMNWFAPGLEGKDWKMISTGFNESTGFNFLHSTSGGGAFVNGEIALSLSWVGQFPVLYDAHLMAGKDFWKFFEYQYVEKTIPDWRKIHPGRRNWHEANICAHLYMRLMLGESLESIGQEMEKQVGKDGKKLLLPPGSLMACENAGFYALYLGSQCPVKIVDWGKSEIKKFTYSPKEKKIHIIAQLKSEDEIVLKLTDKRRKITENKNLLLPDHNGEIKLQAGTGKTEYTLEYD